MSTSDPVLVVLKSGLSVPVDAVTLLWQLERVEWSFSLTAAGDLHVVVGDDHPPRWPQQKIFAVLDAMAPAVIALLAERDGLAGLGDEGTAH